MMTNDTVVETYHLSKVYRDGAVRALDNVNLTIHAGEFLAVVGPSGSGKSTLLNVLGALDRPSSGEVVIAGTPLSKVHNLDRFRSCTIGFVFQMHNLIPTLTALENVEVPLYETMWQSGKRRARARELLEQVGLASRMHYMPALMSGGERQRVAIARALANHPSLVLADEPTGNLDTQNTAEIVTLLKTINAEQRTTFVLVTHNHEVASATQRVITIRDGRVQSDVPVASAFDRDIIDFQNSPLGRAVLTGEPLPTQFAALEPALRQVLTSRTK